MASVRNLLAITLATGSVFLSGCSMTSNSLAVPAPVAPASAHVLGGSIHGGQQPVAGSAINMYAVGTSGYASASTSILNSGVTVTSDGSGNFALTGKYTCPSASSLVYVTATGGDAGAGSNSALAMMAALGSCGSLSSSTFIFINEVSTYAAAAALSGFMSGPAALGTSTTNVAGLTNAFTDVTILASLGKGTSPGEGAASNVTVSSGTLYTVANILAACINSNGPASSACAALFSNTTLNGVTPTETITAALNIAKRPANNATALYNLQTAAAPFQPSLPAAPSDYLLTAWVPTATSLPQALAVDSTGAAWIPSYANVNRYAPNLTPIFSISSGAGFNSVAIDQSNNAWITLGTNKVAKVTSAGTLTNYTPAGVTSAYGVAVDGQGQIWIGNSSGSSISALTSSGTPITGSPFTVPFNPGDLIFSTH